MATDYLVMKWKMWWKALDVKHDGTLSEDDVVDTISNYEHLTHLEGDKLQKGKDTIKAWWKNYIFRGMKGKVNAERFAEALDKAYSADKEAFRTDMEPGFYTIFDVFDINRDHFLSEREVLLVFNSYGHDNLAPEKEFFQKLKPKEGKIALSALVDAMLVFTCDADNKAPDVVKEALEAGA